MRVRFKLTIDTDDVHVCRDPESMVSQLLRIATIGVANGKTYETLQLSPNSNIVGRYDLSVEGEKTADNPVGFRGPKTDIYLNPLPKRKDGDENV